MNTPEFKNLSILGMLYATGRPYTNVARRGAKAVTSIFNIDQRGINRMFHNDRAALTVGVGGLIYGAGIGGAYGMYSGYSGNRRQGRGVVRSAFGGAFRGGLFGAMGGAIGGLAGYRKGVFSFDLGRAKL